MRGTSLIELARLRRLALVAVLALAGCSSVPDFVANSLGLPVREKVVMSKRGTSELIAVDGTSCFVSSGRFREVEPADEVACFWSAEPREDPEI